eukprot:9339541-Alexandrium_andersonii.AAC.1
MSPRSPSRIADRPCRQWQTQSASGAMQMWRSRAPPGAQGSSARTRTASPPERRSSATGRE